jgi:secondary thiamine-phosphate synthase enzyme
MLSSALRIINKTFNFSTKGEIEFIDLSDRIEELVTCSKITNGFVHVFAPHATGIIILTENDSALLDDIRNLLDEIVPRDRRYIHPSNAHSHLRSILFSPCKTLPVVNGRLELGTWQSILFVETDVYPRQRSVLVQIMGQ